ncbi:hypothetical protein ASH00_16195 [Arthrobacter sp. Soil782]|uniref:hypothetical protein n=1 Tax=Arthrobacter sp. Soil782 TaxID=1736410 RepID=UPI0006F23F6B|nr:hypothetical protein [Arthrobacter sp. Soil782]KRF07084.1 hypothetical protein ASH00_16195 [Arthrobacter sp. Soil782]
MNTAHVEAAVEQPRRIRRSTILFLGVIAVPVLLGLALNSYGPLTVDSALRMAAATVAGQTIAILSAVTAVILTIKRRYPARSVIAMVIFAAVVIIYAFTGMSVAGGLLVDRLNLLADLEQANP